MNVRKQKAEHLKMISNQAKSAVSKRKRKITMPRVKIMCDSCGQNYADYSSRLCPGCQAYREHQG